MSHTKKKRFHPSSRFDSSLLEVHARSGFDVNRKNDTSHQVDDKVSPSRLVAGLQAALTTRERVFLLKQLHAFLLKVQQKGEFESFVQPGIFNVLLLQINALLHRHGSVLEEYYLLCQSIDILLQLSNARSSCLNSIISEQGSEIIGLLNELLEFVNTLDFIKEHRLNKVRKSVVSIVHTISASQTGSIIVIGNLTVLMHLVRIMNHNLINLDSDEIQEALGVFKNLTYFADERRRDIISLEGLLPALVALPRRLISATCTFNKDLEDLHESQKIPLLRISAVFRNLSACATTRGYLVRTPAFLNATIDLFTFGECKSFPPCQQQSVLRNALTMVLSLAMDSKESALIILLHNDGILVQIFKRFLNVRHSDTMPMHDIVVRKRSARVLRILVNDKTATLLLSDRELMSIISDSAMYDSSPDVRSEATDTISRCASLVTTRSDFGLSNRPQQYYNEAILDALVSFYHDYKSQQRDNICNETFYNFALSRALKEQAAKAPNRVLIARRQSLIVAAAEIALFRDVECPESVFKRNAIEDACCALMYLSLEKSTRRILCSAPIVLKALVLNATESFDCRRQHGLNAFGCDKPWEQPIDVHENHSMIALFNLTSEEKNLHIMARHEGLLECFLRYARLLPLKPIPHDIENLSPNLAAKNQAKSEVKHIIMRLAQEL